MKRILIILLSMGVIAVFAVALIANFKTSPTLPVMGTSIPATASQMIGTETSTENPYQIEAMKKVASALLMAANQCQSPCFWDIQPGKTTRTDFKNFVLAMFPTMAEDSGKHDQPLEGVDFGAFSISITSIPGTPDRLVDHSSVGVNPLLARRASLNFDTFTPVAIIRSYGIPDQAFLGSNTDVFTLTLLYSSRGFIYTVSGNLKSNGVCLTVNNINYINLDHFANGDAAIKYLKFQGGGKMPPSITETTKQTVKDLAQMAASPESNCFTLTR